MKRFASILLCLLLAISSSLFSSCKKKTEPTPTPSLTLNYSNIGVWWWDASLDADIYLDFAKSNSVTEIYYCDSNFNDKTAEFITKANNKNIKVYFLDGDHNWLNSNAPLFETISKYQTFQETYPNSKFEGIHLDIEPHQNQYFETSRTILIINLVRLAKTLNTLYPKISFDFDIPFWLDDEIEDVIDGSETKISAYKQLISIANRVFVMSYRDTSSEIYEISKEELNYAKQIDKSIFLSVETKSDEGDNVSFMEESKTEMVTVLNELSNLVPSETGIAIHNIKTWYELKN